MGNRQRPDRSIMLENLLLVVCRKASTLVFERSRHIDPCPNAQSCVLPGVHRFVHVVGSSTHPSRIAGIGFHNADKNMIKLQCRFYQRSKSEVLLELDLSIVHCFGSDLSLSLRIRVQYFGRLPSRRHGRKLHH